MPFRVVHSMKISIIRILDWTGNRLDKRISILPSETKNFEKKRLSQIALHEFEINEKALENFQGLITNTF